MRADDGGLRVTIAGTIVEVRGLTGEPRAWAAERYAAFLTERPPDVIVTAAIADDLDDGDESAPIVELDEHGRFLRIGTYRFEGDRAGNFRVVVPPLPSALSPTALRFLGAVLLLRRRGLMLHAAGVVDRGVARVFCGPSESGKTTVAGLAGARSVLSDETVAILPGTGGYRACATPFFGEAGPVAAQVSIDAPLAAIFFLRKSPRFAHRRLSRRDAASRAFSQVFLPKQAPGVAAAILEHLDAITADVPCFELEFAVSDELWAYLDAVA